MAKSPAFLFYSDNFLSGTMFFTMEQRGRYITALCAQHQTGRLTADQRNSITGNDPVIIKKIAKDARGLWHNMLLNNKIEKRKIFCAIQSQGGQHDGKIKNHQIPRYYRGNTVVIPRPWYYQKEIEIEIEIEIEMPLTSKSKKTTTARAAHRGRRDILYTVN